jgi:hypothetical protein
VAHIIDPDGYLCIPPNSIGKMSDVIAKRRIFSEAGAGGGFCGGGSVVNFGYRFIFKETLANQLDDVFYFPEFRT